MAGGSGLRPGAARRLRLGRLALRGAATATSIAGKTRQNALSAPSRRTLSRGPPTARPQSSPLRPRHIVQHLAHLGSAKAWRGNPANTAPWVARPPPWQRQGTKQAFSFGVGRSVGRRGGGPHPTPSPRLELCLAAATWQRRRYRWCHHTLPPPRLRVDRHGGANETGTPTCEQPLRSRHPHPRRQSIRSPQGRRHYRRQHLGGCKSGRSSGGCAPETPPTGAAAELADAAASGTTLTAAAAMPLPGQSAQGRS